MPAPKDPEKYKLYCERISASNKGKVRSEEICIKNGLARKGKKHTEEAKEKNRLKHIGKCHSQETKDKLRIIVTGRKHTEEAKNKVRLSKIGIPLTDKHCYNLSISHMGQKSWNKGKTYPQFSGINSKSYIDGRSYLPYHPDFNDKRKNAARDFFEGYCIITGIHQNDCLIKHSVHHANHKTGENCSKGEPFNLIPMIKNHNSLEIYNQEEYRIYITKTIREGIKWGIWNEEEYRERVMY
jgi:hypothetical protein